MSETTFGCGAFLPGRGPFNFPDFIEGGTVNNGDPPDPPDPPGRTEADPSDPPVIKDPGGGPMDPGAPSPTSPSGTPSGPKDAGGPTSFGPMSPGPPMAGPTNRECRCIVDIASVGPPLVNQNAAGQITYTFTFNQKCTQVFLGAPDPTRDLINSFVTSQNLPVGGELIIEGTGTFADCNTSTAITPKCNGACSVVQAFYIIPPPVPPPDRGPTVAPPGPITPGGPKRTVKKCVYDGKQPRQGDGVEVPGGTNYPLVFTQECKQVPDGTPNPNIAKLDAFKDTIPSAYVVTINGTGYEDCPTGGCDPIYGTLFVPRDPSNETNVEPLNPPPRPRPISPVPIPEDSDPPFTNIGDRPEIDGPFVVGPGGPFPVDPTPRPRGGGGPGTNIGDRPEIDGPFVVGPGDTGGEGITPIGPQSGAGDPDIIDNNGEGYGGGGTNIGELPPVNPEARSNLVGAGVLGRSTRDDLPDLLTNLETISSIDLGNPNISREILAKRPSGFEDEEIFFDDTPRKAVTVMNTSKVTDIFANVIDSNIFYLLENLSTFGDWDSRRAAGVTPTTVYSSLDSETKEILSTILNYDRKPINRSQIYHLIGSRILDGTIAQVTKGSLRRLAKGNVKETPLVITPSKSSIVNETVALGLIERNYYPLEPSASTGRAAETLKNKKTLSSDIDRYIEITLRGDPLRYYVNDDDTFIDRSTLSLEDGEYFDVTLGGETTRLYAQSEKDHAYFVPEKTRQIALNLLGGDSSRTLTVSGDPSGVELDYSLSAPRENLYFLSCVLSSITTAPDLNNNRHVKTTTARYEYASPRKLEEINEYIKYKDNHQTFILDDEDRILDYVERDGQVFLTQSDIIVDSPKENKTMPLLTRQIPWYILLYPTNKVENNPFNAKSQIVDITPSSATLAGSITRQLRTRTSIVPEFRNSYNQFVSVDLVGRGAQDVYQNSTNQARINKINADNKLINSGYVDSEGNKIAASAYKTTRSKTGYRLLVEIVKELDTNYLLGLNGIGKTVTEFDVLSRLNEKQFNLLSRGENFNVLKQAVFNGLVSDVKVTPGTKNADSKLAIRKTQLVRRKSTAAAQDQYPEIKSTNFNRSITPPTTEEPPTFTSFEPAVPPTALP